MNCRFSEFLIQLCKKNAIFGVRAEIFTSDEKLLISSLVKILLFTLDIQKVNSSNTDDEALEEKKAGLPLGPYCRPFIDHLQNLP